MAVDEYEIDRSPCSSSSINEGEGRENNIVTAEQDVISISQEDELFERGQDSSDSSSIFSSEASLGGHIESEAQSAGFTNLSEEEQKGATHHPTTLDKASLISNEPRVASFGQDSSHSSSTKHDLVQEKKVIGKDKTKSPKPTLNRVNSSGSDTTSYSFAFPILAPGLPQRAPRRTEGINPQGRVSPSLDDPDLDGENSISRPKIPPPLQKKSLCCCICCFPCHSIFSYCF